MEIKNIFFNKYNFKIKIHIKFRNNLLIYQNVKKLKVIEKNLYLI
jgi:hypothetical protein